MTRNIGGSLLPSTPFKKAPAPFEVRALPDLDTHGLFHGDRLIAMHSNGHSCLELATRMVSGDSGRVRDQAEYLLACGGLTVGIDVLWELCP